MNSRHKMVLVAAERDLRLRVASENDQVRALRHICVADLDRRVATESDRLVRFPKMIAEFVQSARRKGG